MKGEARSHPTLYSPRPISGILKSESTNSVLRMRTKTLMWPLTKGKLSPRLHRRVSSQLQAPLPGQPYPPSCILPGCKSGVLSKNFPLSSFLLALEMFSLLGRAGISWIHIAFPGYCQGELAGGGRGLGGGISDLFCLSCKLQFPAAFVP